MINDLTNSGSIPVLERLAQFAGGRHRMILNNIANLSTPGFRPLDVSVKGFQRSLGEAIDEKRSHPGRSGGPLAPRNTSEVAYHKNGVTLRPDPAAENIMFQDGNDRNLERTMQSLAENFMVFRQTMDLLRNRFDLLNTAIRERI